MACNICIFDYSAWSYISESLGMADSTICVLIIKGMLCDISKRIINYYAFFEYLKQLLTIV